jgi:hypothetical protein
MTDKNQDALEVFNSWLLAIKWRRNKPTDTALIDHAETIRAALQSRTATSDVSRLKEIINSLFWAYGNHAGPNHIDGLCTEALKIADTLPAMREAWLPIESAPRDGTLFLGLSKFYKDPFVTYWGSAAQERGDIPALPEGSSIQQHWVLANSEDGSVLYEPDYWMPLKCSEPPKGEKS